MRVKKIIEENQGTIVDVRTQGEFMGGNVVGSINIPLQEIQQRIDELKDLKQPLVLCCASGKPLSFYHRWEWNVTMVDHGWM